MRQKFDAADGIIVRDNSGYDFGAWAHALRLNSALFGASLLILTNDSIIPTANVGVFQTMMDRVRACPADIVGLTANHEYGWHVQSYFQAFKPRALSSWAFQHFIRDIKRLDEKDAVIRAYEVPFAEQMQAAGLTVQTLFSGPFSANPTFFGWRALIEQGFPFIKLLMLRKQFAELADWPDVIQDISENWPQVLHKAGFDVDLVRASIRAADLSSVPNGSDTALLVNAKRFEKIDSDHRLRVAYFGPWNYDNGLGSAGRELLGALRHADVQLNIYPITKPFHVHRRICPAVETIDFGGRADIAIVHLNPDSWNVLSEEQRALIASAKQRIGYWVWETNTLPQEWQRELHSVDRVWAPSHYCADVFSAIVPVPVDIIPHPVRIPAPITSPREEVLRRFGIDPAQRVILYIFDGASYLVRKNPHALLRAFEASTLSARGWTLLLKTKHLNDRPEAGRELAELVAATPSARIIEVTLQADEIANLIAAADIYASPHCAEGFGLTVAEAMAMGKPVVATDFSGTRDFLSSECGYPVASRSWVLEEDHGHYLAGHSWAKVDEAAFAEALVQAADVVEAGDLSIGEAARAKIRNMLSYEAVAQAVTASFAALIAQVDDSASSTPTRKPITVPPAPPQIDLDLSQAKSFSELSPSHGVVPISLGADIVWNGKPLPEGDPNDWLFFAPRAARVAPGANNIIRNAAILRPDVVLFYSDDVAASEDVLDRIRLKPEFDRTLLIAQDYIGTPVIVRRKTLAAVGGLDLSRATAVLFDLVLRVAESGGSIGRITEVLIGYERGRPVSRIQDRRAVLADWGGSNDLEFVDGPAPELLVQQKRFARASHPFVTIVTPTRRSQPRGSKSSYIERLLEGIAKADWPMERITAIVGDDIVGEPSWAGTSWPFKLQRIETPRQYGERFNYAEKMNRLWRIASDEHIVFMNDDVVPQNPGWLAALLGFSTDATVGGVGGRLYYEDGTIQHAGMFPALRTVVHGWLGWPADAHTYQNWALTQREWSMVTGAVFATRRSILDRVGGFDERFSLEFNDVDMCLRIRNLGFRIVYNPQALFTHAEKASRGETIPPGEEVALFLSRWSRWLASDPASHPGLAKNRMDPVPSSELRGWYQR